MDKGSEESRQEAILGHFWTFFVMQAFRYTLSYHVSQWRSDDAVQCLNREDRCHMALCCSFGNYRAGPLAVLAIEPRLPQTRVRAQAASLRALWACPLGACTLAHRIAIAKDWKSRNNHNTFVIPARLASDCSFSAGIFRPQNL